MLSNGGALRLTVARYFTPLGRSIQKSYQMGMDTYKEEIHQRIHQPGNGSTQDTAGKKVFFTRKGKALYEAGGITPDISVAMDSTLLPLAMVRFYSSALFNEISFDFYRQAKNSMMTMKTPLAFDSVFRLSEGQWQQLFVRSTADSIGLPGLKPDEKKMIEARIKAQLARYRWGNEGFFKLINTYDPACRKAVDFLKTNKS
jgi:carboxyl-terminal processing protease